MSLPTEQSIFILPSGPSGGKSPPLENYIIAGRGRRGKGELLVPTIQLRRLVLTRHPVRQRHRHSQKPRHLRRALYTNFRTSTLQSNF
jgi:hypothetical protein